ncbi:sensor domain-containing diguanylate cyclase [Photobacterium sp. S4TG1]|uniref:sensor domain-containing diguanylate cyclase n=1 Tax=Photobacterium sp. S4TG1 TaxID=3114587 RepID=UPI002E1788DC|nr:sensor domain-containing diguanylate cyclase [Photobacterium sp. S4TG1]
MSAELVTAYRSFNKILKRLPVEKSLPDMLSQVIELTEETFNHRQTSIFLYDDSEKKFTPFINKDSQPICNERFMVNPAQVHFEYICSKNKLIISENITSTNEYREYYSLKTINNFNFCYGQPILSSQNKILGIIYSHCPHHSSMTDNECELLDMAATVCSISIEKNNKEQELEYLASYDFLTNIWNRRKFYHQISQAIINIKLKNEYLIIFYLDINKFKMINDQYGHHFGDRILKKYASKLQKFSKKTTGVARLGGDEFIIYSEESSLVAANIKKHKVLSELQQIDVDGVHITASIGSYCIHSKNINNASIDSLIHSADMSMYNNKHLSRSC